MKSVRVGDVVGDVWDSRVGNWLPSWCRPRRQEETRHVGAVGEFGEGKDARPWAAGRSCSASSAITDGGLLRHSSGPCLPREPPLGSERDGGRHARTAGVPRHDKPHARANPFTPSTAAVCAVRPPCVHSLGPKPGLLSSGA